MEKDRKKSFIIFIAVTALAVVLCGWAVATLFDRSEETVQVVENTNGYAKMPDVPPASAVMHHVEHQQRKSMDTTLLYAALSDDSVPTQQIGEQGSLEGAIFTTYPMVYADTKYERLPHSPLIRFTDDMIWQDGSANDFRVLRDAVYDQAQNIQEASIALNVSARVEYGKIQGYRLVEIPEDTLFSKLGLVSGDIVLSINGTMPDMEPMALMFVNMVAGKQGASTIEVEHRGVRRTIHLRVAE